VPIGIVVDVSCGINVVVVVVVDVVVVVGASSDLCGSPVEETIPDARMT
jgi:hypothetical protein